MMKNLLRIITLVVIFSMMASPAYARNSNVLAVTPVLSSTNLAGPYVIEKLQEFQVRLQNPTANAYSSVQVKFSITADADDITSLEYYETFNNAGWRPLPYTDEGTKLTGYFGPQTGFGVPAGYDATSKFRVTFAHAGTYPVVFELVDLTQAGIVVSTLEASAHVDGYPELSSPDINTSFVVNRQQEFRMRLLNPSPVASYTGMRVKFSLTAQASDVASMQYYETFNNIGWTNLPYTVSGDQLVGYFGPASGFPVAASYDATSRLRVTFAHSGAYPAKFELFAVSSPDSILSRFESTAKVYDLPSLSSTDLAGPYVVGQSHDFHIALKNPAPDVTYNKALVRFALTAQASDVASLQYYETYNNTGWTNLPYTVSGSQLVGVFGPPSGFPVNGDYNATSSFRVTFARSGSYPVTFNLVDLSTTPETSLSTFTETAVVQDLPAISSANLAGPYVIGKQQEFQVQLQSSPNGSPYSNVRVKFEVPGAKAADLTSIEYYETYNQTGWLPLPLTETTEGLAGYFGPESGFALPANYDATSDFRVTFAKTGDYLVKLTLVDVSVTPETAITSYEATASVYGLPTLSSTNLGASYIVSRQQEFQVRLQNPAPLAALDHALVKFELTAAAADITSLQYYETYQDAGWTDLPFTASSNKLVGVFGPATGFPIPASYNATSRFRVTFANAGAYPVTFSLVDVAAPDTAIAFYTDTAHVYNFPGLSSANLAGPYLVTKPQEFQVRLQNPAPDVDYSKIRIKFTITAKATDIAALKYYETYQDAGWLNLPFSASGDKLVGYFGPESGFPVTGGYDATSRFMVTFAAYGDFPVTFELVDISGSTETVLSSYSGTAKVEAQKIFLPIVSRH